MYMKYDTCLNSSSVDAILFVSADLFRASSYEPGQPGWLGFRDLASPLFPSLKFRCVHMRGRAGVFIWENFHPGYRDLGRKNRDLGNRAGPPSHMNTSKFLQRK